MSTSWSWKNFYVMLDGDPLRLDLRGTFMFFRMVSPFVLIIEELSSLARLWVPSSDALLYFLRGEGILAALQRPWDWFRLFILHESWSLDEQNDNNVLIAIIHEQLYYSVPPRRAGIGITTACGTQRFSDCGTHVSAGDFFTTSLTVSSSHFALDVDCSKIRG
jgi:hypothetical protein